MKKCLFIIFIFTISLLFINNGYAKTSKWNVKIFGTKSFEEKQNITFNVENSNNVLKGKIAPGLKATAEVEIDLTGTKVPVDICAEIDDYKLNSSFKLTAMIDDKIYNLGTNEFIKLEKGSKFNSKMILTLELEWIDEVKNNEFDTFLGMNTNSITIPVKINVRQHI